MPLAPITIQLSKFEQIEILRAEIDAREEELKNTERQIREILFEVEKLQYLQSLHALFHDVQPHQDAQNLPALHAKREALSDAIQMMRSVFAGLEAETAGQAAPPSRGLSAQRSGAGGAAVQGAPRRAKFDSFDDFRSNRAGG